mgnify:CR=1 FL=1
MCGNYNLNLFRKLQCLISSYKCNTSDRVVDTSKKFAIGIAESSNICFD